MGRASARVRRRPAGPYAVVPGVARTLQGEALGSQGATRVGGRRGPANQFDGQGPQARAARLRGTRRTRLTVCAHSMSDAFPTPSDVASALRRVPIFSTLPDEALADLAAQMSIVAVGNGGTLISQNDSGAKLYIVLSGALTLTYADRLGVQRPLPDVEPGETFGEISAVMDAPATATAT